MNFNTYKVQYSSMLFTATQILNNTCSATHQNQIRIQGMKDFTTKHIIHILKKIAGKNKLKFPDFSLTFP